jgi:hypothetical protein
VPLLDIVRTNEVPFAKIQEDLQKEHATISITNCLTPLCVS